MGEPVSVIEKPSANHGMIRFDTNRSLTGMGHERYSRNAEVIGDRPPDVVARLLFATGQVEAVHVYAQTIMVELASGSDSKGLKEIIEDLYIHYKPGVEVPTPESFGG